MATEQLPFQPSTSVAHQVSLVCSQNPPSEDLKDIRYRTFCMKFKAWCSQNLIRMGMGLFDGLSNGMDGSIGLEQD